MILSASDRRLLAEVHHWARVNGWSPRSRGWTNPDDTTAVTWDEGEVRVWRRQRPNLYPTWPTMYPVESIRQAVDLLVALGILPAELSSVYAEGYVCGEVEARMAADAEAEALRARIAELENMLAAADSSGDAFAVAMDYLR